MKKIVLKYSHIIGSNIVYINHHGSRQTVAFHYNNLITDMALKRSDRREADKEDNDPLHDEEEEEDEDEEDEDVVNIFNHGTIAAVF